MIFAITTSNRIFKLLYSNFADKKTLDNKSMFNDKKTKISYLLVNYISLLPTLILLVNSIYNLMLSIPLDLKFTILLSFERIFMSLTVIILMVFEFMPSCDKRLSKV